jgi:hypothetical protein
MIQSNEPSWVDHFRRLADHLPPNQMSEDDMKIIPKTWQITRLLKGQMIDPVLDLLAEPQDQTISQFVKRVP